MNDEKSKPVFDRRKLPDEFVKVYTSEAPPYNYERVCGFDGGGLYRKKEKNHD